MGLKLFDMKTTITLLLTILSLCYTNAQAPAIQWQKSLGGSGADYGKSIQPTSDGGYIVGGYSLSNDGNVTGNHGNSDYWVVKLDAVGTIQWQKSLGGSSGDLAFSVETTPDGGYLVAGYTFSTNGDVTMNNGGSDYWVVKLDATGSIQWQKSLGGSGYEEAYSIQITSDGGCILAGKSNSTDGNVSGNHGGYDYWIVKLDASGNIQWQKSLGGSGEDVAYAIQTTTDGGYIVAGYTYSINGNVTGNHGGYDYWIVKLDASGNIQWQKALGGTAGDAAFAIQTNSDGSCILAGSTYSNNGNVTGNHGGYDYWVVKLDATGIIQWQKTLGGTNYDQALSIQSTSDGGSVVAGYTQSNDGNVTGYHGGTDYWVVKLDDAGTLQWQKALGGSAGNIADAIKTTLDGGYVLTGNSSSTDGDVTGNHGNYDYWVVKLAPDALSITDFEFSSVFSLSPVPAKDVLTITTKQAVVMSSANIYNTLGQLIQVNTNPNEAIDVSGLKTGSYFIRIVSDRGTASGKFLKE